MARPIGARNHDFEEKRAALVEALTTFAIEADLRRPSLRQFALAVNASEPTLRHYFGDRQGVVVAILENMGTHGIALRKVIATPADSPAEAIAQYFRVAEPGLRYSNFTRAHAFGLIEGMADETAGKAYLAYMLEPSLRAIMDKLAGTPNAPSTEVARRGAALAILSPLMIMSIHQTLLGGASETPIDSSTTFSFLQACLGKAFTA